MGGKSSRVSKIVFLTAGTIFILTVVLICGLSIAPRFKKIEHWETESARPVEKILPVSMEKVTALIRSDPFLQGTPYAGLHVFSATDPVFPDIFQLRASAASDPGLERYANLPDSARKNDLYLATFLDDYWQSTYFYNG